MSAVIEIRSPAESEVRLLLRVEPHVCSCWHSLHRRPSQPPGRYGVTSAFWDHVFHSTAQQDDDIAREIHDGADPIRLSSEE